MRCCRKLRQEEALCPVSPVIVKNSDGLRSPQCRGSWGGLRPCEEERRHLQSCHSCLCIHPEETKTVISPQVPGYLHFFPGLGTPDGWAGTWRSLYSAPSLFCDPVTSLPLLLSPNCPTEGTTRPCLLSLPTALSAQTKLDWTRSLMLAQVPSWTAK